MASESTISPADALDWYAGKRVLVTGGLSFIGSHLVELLLDHGAEVRVADDESSGRRENLGERLSDVDYRHGDLNDAGVAEEATRDREVVFHLAALHGGRGYIDTHPVECVGNIALDNRVFGAAALAGAETIVFASSACVYPVTLQESEDDRYLLNEDDANFDRQGAAFPDGEYGWAKLMGELQLRALNKQFGTNGIACRIFTAYGERENESHAVIALIAKALKRLDPYPVWGDGKQTRNFTYVGDTVTGLALAGARLRGFDTINVGSRVHTTVLELLDAIFAVVGWSPDRLDLQLDKPVGVGSRAADVSKSDKQLGWSPGTSVEDGVARTVAWYEQWADPARLAQLDELLTTR